MRFRGRHVVQKPVRNWGLCFDVFVTVAILAGGFLGWSAVTNGQWDDKALAASAAEQSEQFTKQIGTGEEADVAGMGDPIAVLALPAMPDVWMRTVAEGVGSVNVANRSSGHLEHYSGTARPGALGNFAVAGDDADTRSRIAAMRVGDKIFVQSAEGWFTYEFRNFVTVRADDSAVLSGIPGLPLTNSQSRIITITVPGDDGGYRLVAFGVLDRFEKNRPSAMGK